MTELRADAQTIADLAVKTVVEKKIADLCETIGIDPFYASIERWG